MLKRCCLRLVYAFPLASFWLSLSSKWWMVLSYSIVLLNMRDFVWMKHTRNRRTERKKNENNIVCLCYLVVVMIFLLSFHFIPFHSDVVYEASTISYEPYAKCFMCSFSFCGFFFDIDNHIRINMLSFRFCFAMDIHSVSPCPCKHTISIEFKQKSRAKLICSEQIVWHQ